MISNDNIVTALYLESWKLKWVLMSLKKSNNDI